MFFVNFWLNQIQNCSGQIKKVKDGISFLLKQKLLLLDKYIPFIASAFFPLNVLRYTLCGAHYLLQQPLMTGRASETRDFVMLVLSSNFGHFSLSATLKNL